MGDGRHLEGLEKISTVMAIKNYSGVFAWDNLFFGGGAENML